MYMYVLLDVNEITAYDKRSATAWKPRGKLAGVKHSSRSGREGDMEDRGKKKERLGARLITWDQALFIIIIIFFFASLLLWLEREKKWRLIHLFNKPSTAP